MKKILVFSTAYFPFASGAEIAIREVARKLRGEFEFTVVTYRFESSWPRHENLDGIEIYHLGFGTALDRYLLFPLLAFWKARRLLKSKKIDLLWAVMVSYAGIGAYLLKLVSPELPFLVSLQEGDSEEHIERAKFGLIGMWWKALLRRADHVQAISNYLANRAKLFGAKEVSVVPNGVDVEKFQIRNPKSQINSKFQIPNSKSIITTSRLVEKNGVDILVRAAVELKSAIPYSPFSILILGSGPDEAKLKKLAEDLHVENLIEFVGQVNPDEVPQYLNKANIFVRPSRSEGLGSSFLEAMAAGVPVVGTRVGGILDFLRDGQTGLFCEVDNPRDLAEKIRILFEDRSLADKLKKNAYDLVAGNYTWPIVAAKMREIFDSLINKTQ